LARLPADLLRARLQGDDDELRRAAALACARKADQEWVPDLIGLLLDPEPEVAEGARKALQRLTGKDFGPPAGAGQEERAAAPAPGGGAGSAKSCIVLFLMGGPPQHSTWDPKPDAPAEVRGEFGPTDANVPGVRVCSLLPRLARQADKLCLLRAVSTGDS